MISHALLVYIYTELGNSVSKDKIIEHLSAAGYPKIEIDQAFAQIEKAPDAEMLLRFPAIREVQTKAGGRRHSFRFPSWIFVPLVCAVLSFGVFSIIFNSSVFDSQRPSYRLFGVSTTSDAMAHQLNISNDEENQIIIAILTERTILESPDAAAIRNYLKITASLERRDELDGMSDSEVRSTASGMLAGSEAITSAALSSPEAVWTWLDSYTVQVTVKSPAGDVKRMATKVNGVWY